MYLEDLLKLQKELDAYILSQHDTTLDPKNLLTDTILALQVEVSELANETRCFKHWSRKGASEKSIILEEYVDVLHFFLSLGNQLGFTAQDICTGYLEKRQKNVERQKQGY